MKKILRTILISLAALAAGTPATRADETSDLVAAVAASMETQQRMKADVLTPSIYSRPRYVPPTKLSASYLDGIIRSMTKTGRESRTDRKGEL
ncbi:MAG: hypothetical protein K2L11_02780, partial [Muribaculaceae bacterium]|nr:hypothetical protein [Muribaculaceae bacterium]